MPHIFVTGSPGTGKTTLVKRVVQKLSEGHPQLHVQGKQAAVSMPPPVDACHPKLAQRWGGTGQALTACLCPGFYTEEVREAGERVGFDVVTLDGRRGPLARAGAAAPWVSMFCRSGGGPPLADSGVACFPQLEDPVSAAATTIALQGAPTVGKYAVHVQSFEGLALPQLKPRPGSGGCLYVVDEASAAQCCGLGLGCPALPGPLCSFSLGLQRQKAWSDCPHMRPRTQVGKMELASKAFFPAVTALLDAAPLVLGTVPVARFGRTIPQVRWGEACGER